MIGYLFGDDLDPLARFESVASRPLLYEAARLAVGVDPFVRVKRDCRFLQPALVALLLERWAETCDGSPAAILVGEGVGEIAALAAGGVISSYDAIWLAAVRGRLMSHAAASLAVTGLALRDVKLRTARQLATSHDLRVARDAAPDEVVLTGRRHLVDVALGTARKLDVDAVPVPGHRVFPSPDFAVLRRDWRAALHVVGMRPASALVLSCTTVAPIVDTRTILAESLTGAIRLRQSRAALVRLGLRRLDTIPTSPVTA